jgi:REP element-mobilizing transposase RayT
MKRRTRLLNESGIYHDTQKRKRDIFIDDEDRTRFFETIKDKADQEEFQILSYSLMDNQVHILITQKTENISK